MGVGRSTPDTAFQEALQIDNDLDRRSGVIISMRAKRDFPSDAWFAAIAQVVGDRKVITLSQVREDEDRSREIATRLSDLGADARLDPWGSRSDLEQERYVRALYGQSSLVISDRLHVLILASCAGSVPLEITEHAPSKAEEHFAAIGYTGVSLNLSQATGDAVAKFAIEAASRRASLTSLMLAAQAQLDAVESEIHGLIARKNISEVNNHQGARKK
ncbi:hypothetical protein LH407_09815 [Antiquaquibacter oligotrophicus]|nr:hypothetical protein [Antiquaquibacter oligotrophicus]UDF12451.1 hypothetical protein LH407_09815 [Antiquaquibacter oligotrophicus]